MNSIPNTRPPGTRGFTLMEVLIVIVIIAILATAVFMVVPRVRRSAQTTASMNNLRQIHALMSGYVQENNGMYPISVYQDEIASPTWRRKIWEKANGAFDGSPPEVMSAMQQSGYASVMWCPMMVAQHGQDQHPEGRGSYSINRFFMPAAWGGGTRHSTSPQIIGRKEPYIMAGTLFQGDKRFGTFYHLDSSKDPADTYWANLHYAYGADGESALGIFIDGHAEIIPKAQGVKLHSLLSNPTNLE
jgi:prepilin-type N-terminal cleavage/methylation domain-containing protein